MADIPTVDANDVVVEEDSDTFLNITAGRSSDDDDSELLSICITIPSEGGSPFGNLTVASTGAVNVTFDVHVVIVVLAS